MIRRTTKIKTFNSNEKDVASESGQLHIGRYSAELAWTYTEKK